VRELKFTINQPKYEKRTQKKCFVEKCRISHDHGKRGREIQILFGIQSVPSIFLGAKSNVVGVWDQNGIIRGGQREREKSKYMRCVVFVHRFDLSFHQSQDCNCELGGKMEKRITAASSSLRQKSPVGITSCDKVVL